MKHTQALLSAVAAIFISGSALAADLKIGTECTFPPYNYRDDGGNLVGFDIDVANDVCNRIGKTCEFVCQAWDGILPGLLAGKYDLIVASMTDNDERRKKIDFAAVYDFPIARFFAKKGSKFTPFVNGEPNVDGLDGAIVGVQRATTYDGYVSQVFSGVEIKRYDQVDNVYLDLKSGRLDIAIMGQSPAYAAFLSKPGNENFEFIGPAIISAEHFGRGNAPALRKGQDALKGMISKAIEDMHADGSINRYHEAHIGIPQR